MSFGNREFRERVHAFFLPPSSQGRGVWLEALLLTLLALAMGYAADHEHPFFVESEFPWLWFAPILLALRYGMMPGLFSTFLLVLAWLGFNYGLQAQPGEFPRLYFFGGLLAVMVCGEYGDLWHARLRRLNEASHFLDERLSRMTKLHHLLRLSHDRLEQDLLSRPATLRDTLVALRELGVKDSGDDTLPAAEDLLVLLAQYCQLEGAALYSAIDGGSRFQLASKLGEPPVFDPADPLVAYALEHRALAHIQTVALATAAESQFLAVAPLINSDGRLLGMLVVDQMPFFALNQDTLQLLAVMLGYYADSVSDVGEVRSVLERFPICPLEFAEEFVRLWRLGWDHGVNSRVVVLTFLPHADREDMLALIKRMRRGLDVIWEMPSGESLKYVNLMPLCGEVAVEGYLSRIDHLFHQHFGLSLEDAHVNFRVVALEGAELLPTLEDIVRHV